MFQSLEYFIQAQSPPADLPDDSEPATYKAGENNLEGDESERVSVFVVVTVCVM